MEIIYGCYFECHLILYCWVSLFVPKLNLSTYLMGVFGYNHVFLNITRYNVYVFLTIYLILENFTQFLKFLMKLCTKIYLKVKIANLGPMFGWSL